MRWAPTGHSIGTVFKERTLSHELSKNSGQTVPLMHRHVTLLPPQRLWRWWV